ncbi:cytochrome C biogenesis protein [Hahella sp. CCB-MM4]|uniref:DnaJ C-terminal domain-containing protein n=1 Tax=Hahella sp. (strain CCB-MM4) TaxID=1926491 RepID=UPI000B9BBD02|nr:DnaJ C-terminal domain-containing protein [Hahella sp. CCB-MM4]OZG75165.1 cytochrome C biogenesis protein [Hahella sp. CCB-MM4]
MEYKDYYKILGVKESASAEEIKKSYRKLARKYHPDVSKETDAETRFKELGEAYEVLKDPEKRAEYDQLRKMGAFSRDGNFQPPPGWESASHFSSGGFTDADPQHFSDFFEAIFGHSGTAHRRYSHGGRQYGFQMRGDDIHHKLPLFLEEAYSGGSKQITVNIPEVDERGMISHKRKTLNVKIPAGMTSGQHIRLRGQGAPGIGGAENGDLFLEIELAPHPVFSVQGSDILISLPITPWEAALGAQVVVPTLSGKVNLKIPKGAVQGQKLRLKGKGLKGTAQGDQIVILQIAVPPKHSKEAEDLYAKLAEHEKSYNPREKMGV